MNAPGRPSSYDPAYAELAHNYCLLGATNAELARFFQVSPATIGNWVDAHPAFASAVRDGRAAADATIARKLYQRAHGYEYLADRLFAYRGQIVHGEQRVHVSSDVGACVFWLRNRRRHDWMERARPGPAEAAQGRLSVSELERASERARRAHEEMRQPTTAQPGVEP